jgi:dUTP pyrophosphatase
MDPTLVFPLADKTIMHQWPIDYVRLEYKLIHKDARIPCRKRLTDAGYDVASIEDVIIKPHNTMNIKTGIIVVCPPGFYITIDGRSGMWTNGVTPFRAIIDGTYTGEMMVRLMNISDKEYHVKKYDRIAQMIIHEVINAAFDEVKEFSAEYNQRGEAGFGSSGR